MIIELKDDPALAAAAPEEIDTAFRIGVDSRNVGQAGISKGRVFQIDTKLLAEREGMWLSRDCVGRGAVNDDFDAVFANMLRAGVFMGAGNRQRRNHQNGEAFFHASVPSDFLSADKSRQYSFDLRPGIVDQHHRLRIRLGVDEINQALEDMNSVCRGVCIFVPEKS